MYDRLNNLPLYLLEALVDAGDRYVIENGRITAVENEMEDNYND